jgi:hypothetical protein
MGSIVEFETPTQAPGIYVICCPPEADRDRTGGHATSYWPRHLNAPALSYARSYKPTQLTHMGLSTCPEITRALAVTSKCRRNTRSARCSEARRHSAGTATTPSEGIVTRIPGCPFGLTVCS